MYLKTLRLRGFKSFAEPVELHFERGVSVIVGPNGSGKSNVADGLQWAMASQPPSELRTQVAADVLFGGSARRQPSGLCEVELVLDNEDGSFGTGRPEISVMRRLRRDADAQYLLNRIAVRRLDVQEALADAGLGRELHAIVSQGRVDEILLSRPADRRGFIEEAAGLGKYKRRRHRASGKLARVEANLSRARDLEAELKARLRPLALQASAAERAAALAGEVDAARIELTSSQIAAARRLRARIAADLEQVGAERRAARRRDRRRRRRARGDREGAGRAGRRAGARVRAVLGTRQRARPPGRAPRSAVRARSRRWPRIAAARWPGPTGSTPRWWLRRPRRRRAAAEADAHAATLAAAGDGTRGGGADGARARGRRRPRRGAGRPAGAGGDRRPRQPRRPRRPRGDRAGAGRRCAGRRPGGRRGGARRLARRAGGRAGRGRRRRHGRHDGAGGRPGRRRCRPQRRRGGARARARRPRAARRRHRPVAGRRRPGRGRRSRGRPGRRPRARRPPARASAACSSRSTSSSRARGSRRPSPRRSPGGRARPSHRPPPVPSNCSTTPPWPAPRCSASTASAAGRRPSAAVLWPSLVRLAPGAPAGLLEGINLVDDAAELALVTRGIAVTRDGRGIDADRGLAFRAGGTGTVVLALRRERDEATADAAGRRGCGHRRRGRLRGRRRRPAGGRRARAHGPRRRRRRHPRSRRGGAEAARRHARRRCRRARRGAQRRASRGARATSSRRLAERATAGQAEAVALAERREAVAARAEQLDGDAPGDRPAARRAGRVRRRPPRRPGRRARARPIAAAPTATATPRPPISPRAGPRRLVPGPRPSSRSRRSCPPPSRALAGAAERVEVLRAPERAALERLERRAGELAAAHERGLGARAGAAARRARRLRPGHRAGGRGRACRGAAGRAGAPAGRDRRARGHRAGRAHRAAAGRRGGHARAQDRAARAPPRAARRGQPAGAAGVRGGEGPARRDQRADRRSRGLAARAAAPDPRPDGDHHRALRRDLHRGRAQLRPGHHDAVPRRPRPPAAGRARAARWRPRARRMRLPRSPSRRPSRASSSR